MGAGVFQDFSPMGGIRTAGIGGDGMAPRVRHRQRFKMCKVDDVPSSGTPVRGTGGTQGFRDGV